MIEAQLQNVTLHYFFHVFLFFSSQKQKLKFKCI